MHDGRFVELGPSETIYEHPRQDYTQKLIDAVPDDSLENIRRRQQERLAAQAAGGPA
jgi:ABC-type oligopeptide transport system ATPase subunit